MKPVDSASLHSRIRRALRHEIGRNVKLPEFHRLTVVAGNGLTRLAAGLAEQESQRDAGAETDQNGKRTGMSWWDWIVSIYEKLREEGKLDRDPLYLRSRGYSLTEIVMLAMGAIRELEDKVDNDTYKEVWNDFSDYLIQLEPTPLHRAIVKCADAIVTTNYDSLFERAGAGSVSHIHGQLSNPETLVVDVKDYDEWAFERTEEDFRKRYNGAIEALASTNHNDRVLVLFLGLGLYHEETILARLISMANRKESLLVALRVGPDLDPMPNLRRFDIQPVRLSCGLCAPSHARLLAALELLQQLLEHDKCEMLNVDNRREYLKRILEPATSSNIWPRNAADEAAPESRPRVGIFGQCSLNRVIGLEQAPAQERAYSPALADWSPDHGNLAEIRLCRPLICWEAGGQALVPTLVWDSLGVPCCLAGHLLDDEIGEEVMRRLESTKWVDYRDVWQSPWGYDRQSRMPTTENATVITWYGQRVIFDAGRHFDESEVQAIAPVGQGESRPNRECIQARLSSLDETRPGIVYGTKVSCKELQELVYRIEGWQPVVVYDTGGWSKWKDEQWVAKQKGIVIASALSAIGWYEIGPTQARQVGDKADKWYREQWLKQEPRDERGRLEQLCQLLTRVDEESVPIFLTDGMLNDLKAFAVTLGELGLLYWYRSDGDKSQWQEPKWVRPTLDVAEWRDGLGAGDVARAGFVAALLAGCNWEIDRDKLTSHVVEQAMQWAAWFGTQKVRYFSLEEFLSFLRSKTENGLIGKMKSGPSNDLYDVSVGIQAATQTKEGETRLVQDLRTEKADAENRLEDWHEELASEKKKESTEDVRGRQAWNQDGKKWQEKRNITS